MEAIATDVENKEDREGCLERDKKGEKVAKNSERWKAWRSREKEGEK